MGELAEYKALCPKLRGRREKALSADRVQI
jgi:hypothetical protein